MEWDGRSAEAVRSRPIKSICRLDVNLESSALGSRSQIDREHCRLFALLALMRSDLALQFTNFTNSTQFTYSNSIPPRLSQADERTPGFPL